MIGGLHAERHKNTDRSVPQQIDSQQSQSQPACRCRCAPHRTQECTTSTTTHHMTQTPTPPRLPVGTQRLGRNRRHQLLTQVPTHTCRRHRAGSCRPHAWVMASVQGVSTTNVLHTDCPHTPRQCPQLALSLQPTTDVLQAGAETGAGEDTAVQLGAVAVAGSQAASQQSRPHKQTELSSVESKTTGVERHMCCWNAGGSNRVRAPHADHHTNEAQQQWHTQWWWIMHQQTSGRPPDPTRQQQCWADCPTSHRLSHINTYTVCHSVYESTLMHQGSLLSWHLATHTQWELGWSQGQGGMPAAETAERERESQQA
jgi:hypothetical protein